MSLSFQPLDEKDILNLLPPGEYDFRVKAAEDTISKSSGNPMIKLAIAIQSTDSERVIFDYLMSALMYKVKHFCDATGLEDKYQAGTFSAADCINRKGRLKLKIDESEGYAPKNAVQDYVKPKIALQAVGVDPHLNDSIPF